MVIKSTSWQVTTSGLGSDLAQSSVSNIRIIPGLTGLRGLAAWWVVLFHFKEGLNPWLPGILASFVNHGYLAVDLFFVLSGFVIAHNYIRSFSRPDAAGYLRFLGLRLARIYPLYAVMLVLFLVNPLAIHFAASQEMDSQRYDIGYYIMSIFLVQNWGLTRQLAWNVPAWSISTEWLAYMCFPLIAWLYVRTSNSRALNFAGILVPIVLLAAGLGLMDEQLGGDIPKNGLLRCLTQFTTGVFLYQLWVRPTQWRLTQPVSLGVLTACVLVYCMAGVPDTWTMPLAGACTVLGVACGGRIVERIFSSRFAELLGTCSYSTYLVHYFVRDWVKFLLLRDGMPAWVPIAVYLGATAVASFVLFRMVEAPGRRLFRTYIARLTPRLIRKVAGGIGGE
jgi:peptidoglycan/LPS O-acetylase OafA/YrhL